MNSLHQFDAPSASGLLERDLEGLEGALGRLASGLDPDVFDGPSAKGMFERFARYEHICAGVKASFGKRVAESGSWRLEGGRTAEEWMALASGETVTGAISMLKTQKELAELPATAQAVKEGRLSLAQAEHIASAAKVHPAAERELLEAAKTEPVSALKDRCLRVKASATDEGARYETLHRERYFSRRTEADGGVSLHGKFTADKAALIWTALRPIKEQLEAQARKEGRVESKGAHYADALVQAAHHMLDCTDKPKRRGPKHMVHVQISHEALQRGYTKPGELSQVKDFGPVPVDIAKDLMGDAFLTAVVKQGQKVTEISHLGRTINARIQTALLNRDPSCCTPGCYETEDLQVDHTVPVHKKGPTELGNVAYLCKPHHAMKTRSGWRLTGEPGDWAWTPPDSLAKKRKPPP